MCDVVQTIFLRTATWSLSQDALGQIFAAFGGFVHASIRHRIADGQNTSWALVTMADAESVDRTPPHCWHLGLHRERI